MLTHTYWREFGTSRIIKKHEIYIFLNWHDPTVCRLLILILLILFLFLLLRHINILNCHIITLIFFLATILLIFLEMNIFRLCRIFIVSCIRRIWITRTSMHALVPLVFYIYIYMYIKFFKVNYIPKLRNKIIDY